MPYTAMTLGDARSALAQRLADPAFVRWPAAELDVYLHEALRTWNAYTAATRARGVVATTANEPFYDLPTVLPTLRGYTITNRDLITAIQYALLEPATPTAWSGTDQFTLTHIVDALIRRRDQFLRDTAAVVTRRSTVLTPATNGRTLLPPDVLAVRRVAWRTATGAITALRRDDEWGAGHYAPRWPQEPRRPPVAYSTALGEPLQLQVLPPPLDTGALDCLVVVAGAHLNPDVATPLGVPDDWAWVVKWGALADLLSRDGLAADPARAAYCEARWQQGVTAAARAAVLLDARINDQPCRLNSVTDADTYSPRWQSTAGTPRQLVMAGQNLVGVWPPPTAGPWSLSLDLVANIPVPTLPTEHLPVDAAMLDTLLDYAQHLALFKEGAAVVEQTQPLLDRFLGACGVTVAMQHAQQPHRRPLVEQTTQDTRVLPVQAEVPS